MAEQVVIVTGLAQLDATLATLEPKIQKKFVRKALRNCAKQVVLAVKEIIKLEAYNLGVLYESFKVRALKRRAGRVGVAMFVDREKLFADYTEKYGHPPRPRKPEKDPYYYLASIEFGFRRPNGTEVPAVRPMRRALYDNAARLKEFFAADLRELVAELNKRPTLEQEKPDRQEATVETIEAPQELRPSDDFFGN